MLETWYNPATFNEVWLRRHPYWGKQRQVCDALQSGKKTVLVPSGNATGKSWMSAGLVLWYLATKPGAVVVTTAPTHDQLANVLWRAIWGAKAKAPIPLFEDRATRSPLLIENVESGGYAIGLSSATVEAASGHHAENLLVVIDEASGVEDDRISALNSLNPSNVVMIGNPLLPSGVFYERCVRQELDPDENTALVRIRSDETPPVLAGVQRSPTGLADLDFLERSERDYGRGSAWWLSHIEAMFPNSVEGQLFAVDWINRCVYAQPPEHRQGLRRIAVDIATGRGGDMAVIMTRDDSGILDIQASNIWDVDDLAKRTVAAARQWNIPGPRVVYDSTGVGETFGTLLRNHGLTDTTPFQGGRGTHRKFQNLRAASYWALRRRINPDTSPEPFHIPREFSTRLQKEMLATTFELTAKDQIAITKKEDIIARIGHSPDFVDTLAMSFGFAD